jgi:uncharacterized protein
MGTAENKELIRQMFAEISKGNAEVYLNAVADDVQYTIIGTGKYSSLYNGKQDVIARLLGPLGAQIEGNLEITPFNFIAEGEYVAMQANGKSMSKNGVAYNNTYCHVFRIVNGKIKEITEYLDTELVTRAFGS